MSLTHQQIREIVIECLRPILSDELQNINLSDNMEPINNLGLESRDGLVFAINLSEKLPFPIPNAINPLVDDLKKRARTIGQIVDLIHKLILAQGEEGNA